MSNKNPNKVLLVLDNVDDAYSMTSSLKITWIDKLNRVGLDIEPQCPIPNYVQLFEDDVDKLIECLQMIKRDYYKSTAP